MQARHYGAGPRTSDNTQPVEKLPRRISGYNLDELLPERGFNVARALVGTGAAEAVDHQLIHDQQAERFMAWLTGQQGYAAIG